MIATIEQEVNLLITFLSQSAGFSVGVSGKLSIYPLERTNSPTIWEVYWEDLEKDPSQTMIYNKQFSSLLEAAQFFVEKRRFMCLGFDFDEIKK